MIPQDAGKPDSGSPPAYLPRETHPVAGRIGGEGYRTPFAAAAAAPAALTAAPDVWTLLAALRQRWVSAFVLSFLLGLVAGAGAWFLLTPKHTAFARIQVAFQSPVVGESRAPFMDFPYFQSTTANKIKTRPVIWAALKRPEVARLSLLESNDLESVVQMIEDDLRVESSDKSEIITIQYSHADPHVATVLANAIKEAFVAEYLEAESRKKAVKLTEMERNIGNFNSGISAKRTALAKFISDNENFDPVIWREQRMEASQLLKSTRDQSNKVKLELVKAKADLKSFDLQLKAMKAAPGERTGAPSVRDYVPRPSVPRPSEDEVAGQVEIAMDKSARVRRLREDLAKYEADADDLRRRGIRETYSSRRVAEENAQRARGLLAKEEAAIDASVRRQIDTQHRKNVQRSQIEYEQRIKEAEAKALERLSPGKAPLTDEQLAGERERIVGQIAALEKHDEQLEKDAKEYQAIANRTAPGQLYEEMVSGIKEDDKMLVALRTSYEHEKLEAKALPRVASQQNAELMKKEIKKQALATLVAPLAVACAVCGGLALMEHRKRKVRSTSEISRGLGIRVVGAVPKMAQLERHLVGPTGESDLEGTPVMESIDAIRTRLLHEADVRATRVVVVTSATAGEGKTTLAAALASSLARAGRKTLLLDGDLRRPTVHELFEVPMQPGFSEVLLGEIEVAEAAVESSQENLSLLPAGQWDREVLLALSRDGLEGVFDKLSQEFDFIVVDSHPVLAATDSLLLGRQADAVVLSVLRETSQLPRVYAAHQQLTALGVRVLGAVVSAADPEEVFASPASAMAAA